MPGGYSPASTVTSNLPQSTVIQYDKKFVKNLKANTPFVRITNRRELDLNSGNQLRLYMYQTFGPNLAQQSEGTVGSGITPVVNQTTATIGQYADYCSLSDLSMETAIDPALENIQREMGYRLAQTLSIIVRNTLDSANAIDASVSTLSKAANAPLTRVDITSAAQSLGGKNVMPFDTAKQTFGAVIHPFGIGDILNDSANNSLVDVLKRTVEGQMELKELPESGEDEVRVIEFSGVQFYESTLVTQTPNYQASGKTGYRTYIVGEDASFTISLGPSKIGDGYERNLKLYINGNPEPTVADPSRVIGGWTSYNVKFTTSLPPDTTMRLRYIDANSTVS